MRNSFKAQLEARRAAVSATASPPPTVENPTPDPAAGFQDPDVRREVLSDELRDARAEIARERERRQAAERRAAALEADAANANSRMALSNLISKKRRRPWR